MEDIERERGFCISPPLEDDMGFRKEGQFTTYEALTQSRDYLLGATKLRPQIAIICGSGLGSLGEMLDISQGARIPYERIPHFPKSTAPGHKGMMSIGTLPDLKIPIICMQGRFHLYEGYSAWTVSMPCRVFKLMGVRILLVTNAAGGINPDFRIGDIMILKDHVNFPGFAGVSPLRGPNDPAFGCRFTALHDAYDKELRGLAKLIGSGLKIPYKEGVYGMVGGPAYETPAELRLIKNMGVDAVGMSTVQEVIAARHSGIRCCAFSIITNLAKFTNEDDTLDNPNEQEVIVQARQAEIYLQSFVLEFIKVVYERVVQNSTHKVD